MDFNKPQDDQSQVKTDEDTNQSVGQGDSQLPSASGDDSQTQAGIAGSGVSDSSESTPVVSDDSSTPPPPSSSGVDIPSEDSTSSTPIQSPTTSGLAADTQEPELTSQPETTEEDGDDESGGETSGLSGTGGGISDK